MGCIYKISFPNTDKVYIGITSRTAQQRFNEHRRESNDSLVSRAIKSHGFNNTSLIVLFESNDYSELLLLEQVLILEHNSINPNGYNLTSGGEGVSNLKHSFESKVKMGKSQKLRFLDEQEREKAAIKTRDYFKNNPDAKSRMSRIKKEKVKNDPSIVINHKIKMKEFWDNNPDARLRMSSLKKQYHIDHPEKGVEHSNRLKNYFTNEVRLKLSNARKGIPCSKISVIRRTLSLATKWAIRLNRPFSYIPGCEK